VKFIKISFLLFSFFLLSKSVYAFEGYDSFPMKGNTIFPLEDVAVRLAKIKVLMERREENSRSTTIIAEYDLYNLSDNELNFQIAYPVESNCINCTEIPKEFKVFIDGELVETSITKMLRNDFVLLKKEGFGHKAEGKDKLNKNKKKKVKEEIPLITWDISFKPLQKKTVVCKYTLKWLLDPGVEIFEYLLATIYLWKEEIEEAYFRLTLPQELIYRIKKKDPSIWPKVSIYPKYRVKDNTIEWIFKNLKKEKIKAITVDVDYRKPGMLGD